MKNTTRSVRKALKERLKKAKEYYKAFLRNRQETYKRDIAKGDQFLEAQRLLHKMTNWQRHQYRAAVRGHGGPLTLTQVRELAVRRRPSKKVRPLVALKV